MTPAPVTFELIALSQGEGEPVEFYYGVDDPREDAFDTLEKRLRSIYPSSFDIERVEEDLIAKLVPPVKYPASEFADRLEQGKLYYDPDEDDDRAAGHTQTQTQSGSGSAASADGGVDVSDGAQTFTHPDGTVTLDPPSAVPDDRSLSHLSRPTLATEMDEPESVQEDTQTDSQGSEHEERNDVATSEDNDWSDAAVSDESDNDGEQLSGDEQYVYARPPLDEITPAGVRWEAHAVTEKKDSMTMLKPFSEQAPASVSSGELDRGRDEPVKAEPPLATLIDHLTEASQPLAFQVLFRPKEDWSHKAKGRRRDIQARTTTSYETGSYNSGPGESGTSIEYDVGPDEGSDDQMRLDLLDQVNSKQSFFTNVRAFSALVDDGIPPDLDEKLDQICPAFDMFDGEFYRIEGERFGQGLRGNFSAKWSFKRFRERTMKVGSGLIPGTGICQQSGTRNNCLPSNKLRPGGRRIRPDFILDPDELANLLIVPPSNQLSVEAARGARAEQEARNPQPRPHQDIMGKLRTGLATGFAKDNDGNPEDVPTCIPPELLTLHYLRTAITGAGKSVALDNDILSLYETTDGPIFVVDAKGGDLMENYMRSHAARFGFEDLEENVLHFNIPDILPGISFFDIRAALDDGRSRTDAIQYMADYYEEIIKLVMGKDRYEKATAGPTLIKHLVKALYDEEHGLRNGNKDGMYRESIDYFGHDALEREIDQLREADEENDLSIAPQSSDKQTQRVINRRLKSTERMFGAVIDGVENRVGTISEPKRLRKIFNNTEPQFSFRDLLDERKVILLDLGNLREESAQIMTAVILTKLYDALRDQDQSAKSDDYIANLLIDEAASVVVSDTMNTLLSKGREFNLGVGLATQFPQQFEEEGNRKVYLNALNNIGTKLVGKINVDKDLARALSHENLEPEEVNNVISALPRGELLVQIPSPTFGETGPTPFTAQPMKIPAGHPESENSFTDEQEARFQKALARVHEHTQNEYGIVDDEGPPEEQTPEEILDLVGLDTNNLDVLLAHVVGNLQLRVDMPAEPDAPDSPDSPGSPGSPDETALDEPTADDANSVTEDGDETPETGRDANVWIAAEDVDDEIEAYFERVEGDVSPPSRETLSNVREKSQLFEMQLGDEHQPVVRLTAMGENTVTIETGSVQASGGEDHDSALERMHTALSARGYHVQVFEQDRSDMGDAQAFHPDDEETYAIEAETTTPDNPGRVLENLRRAQEDGHQPVFVVEPGEDDKDFEYWANRVEGILNPPVKNIVEESGDVALYTTGDPLRFNGGRAVREATSEGRLSLWTQKGEELVLTDSLNVEHATLSSLDEVGAMREFPGVAHYNETDGSYTVIKDNGGKLTYPDRESLRDRWIEVKRPFIPEIDLPNPEFDHDDYHIVILPEDDTKAPVVYRDGATHSLDTLTDRSIESTTVSSPSSTQSEDGENKPSEQESAVNENPDSDANKSVTDTGIDDNSQKSGTESETSMNNVDGSEKTPDEELRDPDEGVAAFAATYLVEGKDTVTPTDEIYDQYERYTDEYQFETRNRSQFTRSLKREVGFEFESERKRIDGDKTTVYVGVDIVSR
ncbi:primase-like DNA-binding domain-containing protein [Halococcus thailandensis]|uniref:Conjugation protein n=1 Tax=Halococcus thailandensis JCM 13552 TaxID=1227457 RepID=M0NI17_9EURY|nr:primase-like DNA-binding domain-containing protein [Halococcus thailandensis]EMA56310.1 conjugation protein [Halococcus thailandensis JCM 13552]